eukprot:TRINITY_DN7012_c0_g1_i1.p1 TRINITY_DN7012_c0_g1~~TRINITY_DN7012_c0_g1_i1.p1  ORF type:complete len:206 (-),score=28.38 TRINITY_DN7012_c0_g1_i1:45-662(-)
MSEGPAANDQFGIDIQINSTDMQHLIEGEYVFAIQRVVSGALSLQWVTFPLCAPSMQIRWPSEFRVFLSLTPYAPGAKMISAAKKDSPLGQGWEYQPLTAFTPRAFSPPVGVDQVGVYNGLGAYASYGLECGIVNQDGTVGFYPACLTPLLPPGYFVTWTPSSDIGIYFITNTTSPGTVVKGWGPVQPVHLQVNQFPTYKFVTGQ